MNILHVLHRTPVTGGALAQMIDAVQGVSARGHNVTVVTRTDPTVARRCADLGVSWHALRLRHALDVGSMRFVADLVARESIDVVHAHCGVSLGVTLGAGALGARFALVVDRSTSFRPRRLLANALASARVHRVVVTSRRVREILLATTRLPAAKAVVVPGSVDPVRFDAIRTRPSRARQLLGIPASAVVIGHVGIREWKGWKHSLAVLAAVREAIPAAHLALVGCASERQRRSVLALIAELALTENVSVGLATDTIADVLAACDVVIDSSWAGTGVSGVIREAMALARPVVATSLGGNDELIEDGVSGILVPPRDVATMAAAVTRVVRDAELATGLGAAARERVRGEFTVELRAVRLVTVYRAALDELAATG